MAHDPKKRCIDLIDRIDALYHREDGRLEAADFNNSCHSRTFLRLGECPPRKGDPWMSIAWSRGAPGPMAFILSPPGEGQRIVAEVLSRFPDWAAYSAHCLARAEAHGCLHIMTQADADAYAARPARLLSVDCNAAMTLDRPDLESLDDLLLSGPVVLHAPAQLQVKGQMQMYGASLDAPRLTRIGGKVLMRHSSRMDAPALAEVEDALFVMGSLLFAPALRRVHGAFSVPASSKLPRLAQIGEMRFEGKGKGATLHFDALERIDGNLQILGRATVHMPILTEIGGKLSLAAYEPRPRLIAPELRRVGGKPWPKVAEQEE